MSEIEELKELVSRMNEEIINLRQEVSSLRKKDTLQEEFQRTLKRNKKNIIKQKIQDLMFQYEIPIIKEIIVDKNSYCSKATFYRYVDEIKNMHNVMESSPRINVFKKEDSYL